MENNMTMLSKIAWRNIWRNRRRSLIIISSMVVGYAALIFMDSLMTGMIRQMLSNQIGTYTAHIEIHRTGYMDNPIIQNFIPEPGGIKKVLDADGDVTSYCERVLTFGMISSASASAGVTIVGIEPGNEKKVTTLDDYLIRGHYLTGNEREIMLSEELSEKLEVDVGDKVVAMASGMDGTIGSELFRVVGIFRTPNVQFDRMHIYIPQSSARALLSMEEGTMEFAVTVSDINVVDRIKEKISSRLGPSLEVLTYRDIHPFLIAQFDLFNRMMLIFYSVLGVAIMFGVINTMLMAVMERINEFGILSSIGMSAGRIFSMVLLEGLMLGIAGTVIGVTMGVALSLIFARIGIDFSIFRESLAYFGAGAVIYPVLTAKGIITAALIVPATSIIGTLYPGSKAARLEPIEALRYI